MNQGAVTGENSGKSKPETSADASLDPEVCDITKVLIAGCFRVPK
ncbi:hypothetical protein OAL43_02430 [bacterium]|nr:hypothetical protein [bacterium]